MANRGIHLQRSGRPCACCGTKAEKGKKPAVIVKVGTVTKTGAKPLPPLCQSCVVKIVEALDTFYKGKGVYEQTWTPL